MCLSYPSAMCNVPLLISCFNECSSTYSTSRDNKAKTKQGSVLHIYKIFFIQIVPILSWGCPKWYRHIQCFICHTTADSPIFKNSGDFGSEMLRTQTQALQGSIGWPYDLHPMRYMQAESLASFIYPVLPSSCKLQLKSCLHTFALY